MLIPRQQRLRKSTLADVTVGDLTEPAYLTDLATRNRVGAVALSFSGGPAAAMRGPCRPGSYFRPAGFSAG